ncbi:sensor histidine kinase [Streptomyces sp. RG80]|uniref:sensor histidine kinase n=1 Tax=Streptomyces sp. RG80 TaxID=3157340 RepID=UPI00338F2004
MAVVVQVSLALPLALAGLFLEQVHLALTGSGIGALSAVLTAVARPSKPSADTSVERAVDVERNRLRHDLHDGLGPLLSGIGLCALALSELLDERGLDREHALLDRIRTEVSHATTEVRRLIDALPPGAVAALGLVGALRDHARFVPPPTAVEIVACALPVLPPAVEAAVYRIVMEAMTNVVRHADARHVRVTLAGGRRSLLVSVADDGRGIVRAPAGVGLTSIRNRAEAAGGTLRVRTAPGRGTEVRVRLPLSRTA